MRFVVCPATGSYDEPMSKTGGAYGVQHGASPAHVCFLSMYNTEIGLSVWYKSMSGDTPGFRECCHPALSRMVTWKGITKAKRSGSLECMGKSRTIGCPV